MAKITRGSRAVAMDRIKKRKYVLENVLLQPETSRSLELACTNCSFVRLIAGAFLFTEAGVGFVP